MLFCSQQFLVFFLAVFALYWAIPWSRFRIYLLLVASFAFYASWNRWLAGIICVSTFTDYVVGRLLERPAAPLRRKLLLAASLCVNLGLLGYFKYADFFLRSLEDVLRAAGANASLPVLKVLLPVGISFYTFEAISYTVDVYRRRIPAERNLAHFMLFILFFPHLIAGPIVRARDFLPQLRRRKHWDWARLNLGLQFFLMGLFKKVVIADRMAIYYVDPVFSEPGAFSSGSIWLAALAWALQVYCDFSGYSDMAIGCAHMLGYKLGKNFDMPYLATNMSELWRRWHISLTSWIRDYLFIPLGGSRGSAWQTARNVAITMALCGLWHGARWTYVVFGLLQAGILLGHRAFRGSCRQRPNLRTVLESAPGTAFRVSLTFLAFCCTLVVFRADTVLCGFSMLRSMAFPHGGLPMPLPLGSLWCAALIVAISHLIGGSGRWKRLALRLPAPVIGIGQALTLSLALMFAMGGGKTFIYFQF